MRLSGWVRLWIVAGVVWWAAGAWWLIENHLPNYVSVVATDGSGNPIIDPKARARREAAERDLAAILAKPVPAPPSSDDPILRMLGEVRIEDHNRKLGFARMAVVPFTESDHLRISSDDWSDWTFKLYLVILAPFLGGLAFVIFHHVVRWIWRGFRSETHRANSN